MIDRLGLFLIRFLRAFVYWRRLHYSWRLAWVKSGWSTLP